MATKTQISASYRDESGQALVGFRYDDVTGDVIGVGGVNNTSRNITVQVGERTRVLTPGQQVYVKLNGITSSNKGRFQKIDQGLSLKCQ